MDCLFTKGSFPLPTMSAFECCYQVHLFGEVVSSVYSVDMLHTDTQHRCNNINLHETESLMSNNTIYFTPDFSNNHRSWVCGFHAFSERGTYSLQMLGLGNFIPTHFTIFIEK